LSSILFGLFSALSWGGGDFFGGLASRKTGAYRAVFYGEVLGLFFLFGAVAFRSEVMPDWQKLVLAGTGGAVGSIGLLILYQAMITGRMSIATPVSALLAATLPVAVGMLLDGLPAWTKLAGFALALLAVWLVAQEHSEKTQLMRLSDLRLPLLAGSCFGIYFILMHLASTTALVWPMVASRSAGALALLIFMFTFRQAWHVSTPLAWPLIGINAILDVGGNLFYILAGQTGRMDVAAVLSSLYPGITVLLAGLVLKEKINTVQWLGILAALAAIMLMTIKT
jgi:drug/metabolite transporter (DMT)-like permease